MKFLVPNDAGLQSTDRAVGKRVAKLLDALDSINSWVTKGEMVQACTDLKDKILAELRAEGWRIKVTDRDSWQVLPPK